MTRLLSRPTTRRMTTDDDEGGAGPRSDAGASGDDDVYEAYLWTRPARLARTPESAFERRRHVRDALPVELWGIGLEITIVPKLLLMLDQRRDVASRRVAPRARSRPRASMQPLLRTLMGMMLKRCISYMLRDEPAEEAEMLQDAGYTRPSPMIAGSLLQALVARASYAEGPGGFSLPAPMPALEPVESREPEVWAPDGPWDETTTQGRFVEETQEVIKPTVLAKVEIREFILLS